jgi:hypothetical protein
MKVMRSVRSLFTYGLFMTGLLKIFKRHLVLRFRPVGLTCFLEKLAASLG